MKLGLDIGGTNIKTVVLDDKNETTYRIETPSDANQGPTAVRKAINKAIAQAPKTFCSIGIGCAGSVDTKNGIVINSPNFADWSNVPLGNWISQDSGKPVTVHNDANCAAVAEHLLGAGRDTNNFVLLTFGTGIGGGIILGKKLLTGSTGAAGELGHLSIKFDGAPCPCGNTGCFERYCSATFLREKFPDTPEEKIFSDFADDPTVVQFFLAMKIALTSIANIFDPDRIALGGGLSGSFGPHIADIENWVKTHAFPTVAKHISIHTCELGNWGGAIGAALEAR